MRRRCARSLAWRTVFRIPPSRGRGVGYGGLFPFYGTHPHFLLMENWQFALWPLLSHARRRAADHWYALWPLATWACYDEDRDTSGAGYSWMFWPCYGTALGGLYKIHISARLRGRKFGIIFSSHEAHCAARGHSPENGATPPGA